MIDRIVRAIRLDWTVFGEIAQDREAMTEAAIIVAIVTGLSALGSAAHAPKFVTSFLVNWLLGILSGWFLWAAITYFVGTVLFKGETTIAAMLRVLGYASAPLLLGVLGFVPCIGVFMPFLGRVLALIAGVLAIREALDLDTGQSIVTVVISWFLSVSIQAVFWFLF